MRWKLLGYFIFVSLVTNGASLFAVTLLYFFGAIFVNQGIDVSNELMIVNEGFLVYTPFLFAIALTLLLFWDAYRVLFMANPRITKRVKMIIVHVPSISAMIAMAAWLFSVAQLIGYFWYYDLPYNTFVYLSIFEQLITALAAYAITYFVLDFANKDYFIARLLPQNRLEYLKRGAELSLGRKMVIYYSAVGLFPLATFGGMVYYLYATQSTQFSTQQYTMLALFIGMLVVIGIVLTRLVTMGFSTSLAKLQKATEAIKHGDFAISLRVTSIDELGNLMERINRMARHIALLNSEIVDTQKEVVLTMGAIGESRSQETGNHVRRVARYSYLLAKAYGLDEEAALRLQEASPMHDIGKVAIPDTILNKPAKLTPEEFEVMKRHASLGYEMLAYSHRPLLQTAAIVAHTHHEKWDGSGYPQGLIGEAIPIEGRITAVVDVFDALGSDRVYKKAWSDAEIFAFFREQSGRHFDPKLIELFFVQWEEIATIRAQLADTF